MNTNDDRRYPIDYSDDEINGEIAEKLNLLALANRMSIKQMRHYVQITLGQTELQSRSSEKARRATKTLSVTALVLSVAAILFSGIISWSSSRSADQWRTDKLAILENINSNISSSRKSIAARAPADAVTLKKWRDDQMSILRNIDQSLLGILGKQ